MRVALYGNQSVAALVAAAALCASLRLKPAHRNPKYFNPADKPGPFDLVITHDRAPNVDAVVAHFQKQGARVACFEDNATEDDILDALEDILIPRVKPAPVTVPTNSEGDEGGETRTLEQLVDTLNPDERARYNASILAALSYPELQKLAKQLDVPATGKRSELEAAVAAKQAAASPAVA